MQSVPMRCSDGVSGGASRAERPRYGAEAVVVKAVLPSPTGSSRRTTFAPPHLRNDRALGEVNPLASCGGFSLAPVRGAALPPTERLGGGHEADRDASACARCARCVPALTMHRCAEATATRNDSLFPLWRACHRAALHRIWSNA